jgi:hypothetical protein
LQEGHLLRFADGAAIDKGRPEDLRVAVLMDRDASHFLFWDAATGKVHIFDVRDRERAPVSLAVDIFPYHVAVAGDRLLLFGWDADQMRRGSHTPKHVCISILRGAAGATETGRAELPHGTVRTVDPSGRLVIVYRQTLPTLWTPFVHDMETGKSRTLPMTGLYVFAERDWIGELMHSKAQSIPLP